ncbi:MAG: hypothetical protein ACE5FK_08190 [Candidatus Methylomirabilia bacterium]
MIDATDALVFSLYSNRGAYALLLGSGVSRAAGIPTGWEVTLDLIRKLAASRGEDPEPNPEEWYRSVVDKDLSYLRIPEHREHRFRSIVNTDSGDVEHRFRAS